MEASEKMYPTATPEAEVKVEVGADGEAAAAAEGAAASGEGGAAAAEGGGGDGVTLEGAIAELRASLPLDNAEAVTAETLGDMVVQLGKDLKLNTRLAQVRKKPGFSMVFDGVSVHTSTA